MAVSNSTDGILQLADTSGASGATVTNTQKAINDANTAITTNTTNIAANTTAIALKAPIASPTFTGAVTAPTFVGALTGNASTATSATSATTATNFSGSLAGDVTGTQSATAISAATVTGKALTGYISAAGTVSATDTILQAIQKINGNDALKAPIASPTFTGTVTAPALTLSTALSIANGGTGQTTAATAINALVPTQTSNSGKFLTTNGTVVSWATAGGAASVVKLRVTGIPTGTLANGAFNVATFPTVQVDSASGFSSGVYTIPKTAYYDLYASVNITGSFSSYGGIWIGFQFNGSGAVLYRYSQSAGTNGQGQGTAFERAVLLTVGTTVQPTVEVPGWTTAAYGGDSNTHTFSIIEVP